MNAAARLLNQGVFSRGWVVSVFLSRSHASSFILSLAVLVSALSIIYVTNVSRGLNAHMEKMLIERDQFHLQWGQLLLEKSTAMMQARVQYIASNQLGMLVPTHKSVIVIKE